MAQVTCVSCGHKCNQIIIGDCPECGYIMDPKRAQTQVLGCFIFIFIGLLSGAWFLFSLYETQESESIHWTDRDNSMMAYHMTKDWVKERLVSPSTTSFPNARTRIEHTQKMDDQVYRIQSYVDSQNRIGATIRTDFVAEVRQISGNRWRLLFLEF